MASPWATLAASLADRVDAELLPALYERASLPTAEIRRELQQGGVAYWDPETGQTPDPGELEAAARAVTKEAVRNAVAVGVVSGFAGAIAVPPEVATQLVGSLRLAQRFAVIYGFDPEKDSGKVVMWRAIAAAYDVTLPAEAKLGIRVRELPAVVSAQLPAGRAAGTWLAQFVLSQSAAVAIRRAARLVPGLGAGVGGWNAQSRTSRIAEKMLDVFRRASQAMPFDTEDEEVAVEIRGPEARR